MRIAREPGEVVLGVDHAAGLVRRVVAIQLRLHAVPALRVVDFKKAGALARQHKLISMIDSTFGTPINQHPAEYGIDVVMHSGTKYLSGHADLTCGVVAGRRELMEQIHETRTTLGNCMDPHAAWLLIRGLKTLAVRVASLRIEDGDQ